MVPPPLSEAKQQALKIVPRITAALSVLGSAFILVSILTLRRRKMNHRTSQLTGAASTSLLVGMSVADLLSSSSYVIGSVAFPESIGGHGNNATCNGAFFSWQLVGSLSNVYGVFALFSLESL